MQGGKKIVKQLNNLKQIHFMYIICNGKLYDTEFSARCAIRNWVLSSALRGGYHRFFNWKTLFLTEESNSAGNFWFRCVLKKILGVLLHLFSNITKRCITGNFLILNYRPDGSYEIALEILFRALGRVRTVFLMDSHRIRNVWISCIFQGFV